MAVAELLLWYMYCGTLQGGLIIRVRIDVLWYMAGYLLQGGLIIAVQIDVLRACAGGRLMIPGHHRWLSVREDPHGALNGLDAARRQVVAELTCEGAGRPVDEGRGTDVKTDVGRHHWLLTRPRCKQHTLSELYTVQDVFNIL